MLTMSRIKNKRERQRKRRASEHISKFEIESFIKSQYSLKETEYKILIKSNNGKIVLLIIPNGFYFYRYYNNKVYPITRKRYINKLLVNEIPKIPITTYKFINDIFLKNNKIWKKQNFIIPCLQYYYLLFKNPAISLLSEICNFQEYGTANNLDYNKWTLFKVYNSNINFESTNVKDILSIGSSMYSWLRENKSIFNYQALNHILEVYYNTNSDERIRYLFHTNYYKKYSSTGKLINAFEKNSSGSYTISINYKLVVDSFLSIVNPEIRDKLLEYLKYNYQNKGIGSNLNEINTYKDYAYMANTLGHKIKVKTDYNSILKLHDKYAEDIYNIRNSENSEEFAKINKYYNKEYSCSIENWHLTFPKTKSELYLEGMKLSHCVASYFDKIIDRRCIIAFLRKDKNIPLITVELDMSLRYIRQARGYGNRPLSKEEQSALKELHCTLLANQLAKAC
jgi:hypothetical protein